VATRDLKDRRGREKERRRERGGRERGLNIQNPPPLVPFSDILLHEVCLELLDLLGKAVTN
jgi:hypothetical protein